MFIFHPHAQVLNTILYSFVRFSGLFARQKSSPSVLSELSGCQIAWQRFEVHLDAVRARTLPEPWPWIWVLNEETCLLLQLRTLTPPKKYMDF